MDANVYTDPAVIQESQNFVTLKVNAGTVAELPDRYNVNGLPTIIWMDSAGVERGRQEGAVDANQLISLMQRYR